MSDIEDLVRRSLETRARDVTPDPATWAKVGRRIHRERTFRFALAGAAAATAAIAAAVAVPTLLNRSNRVDLGTADQPPGSESEQHDVSQTAVPSEAPFGTVLARLLTSRLSNPPINTVGIDVLDEAGQKVLDFPAMSVGPEMITDVAVRPGSTPTDLTVIHRVGIGCEAQLGYVSAGSAVPLGGRSGSLGADDAACPKPAVWSPDGRLAAWVEGEPGAYLLRIVEVAVEPNDLGTLFNDVGAWPLLDEGLRGLEVVDWLQFNDGSGALHFLGEASDGRVLRAVQSIETDAPGEVWLFQGGASFQVLPTLSSGASCARMAGQPPEPWCPCRAVLGSGIPRRVHGGG